MKIERIARLSGVAAFTVAALFPWSLAASASLGPADYAICGSATQLAAVARSLGPEGADVRISTPAPSKTRACSSDSTRERIEQNTVVRRSNAISLQAVLEYRATHPWPLGAADLANPDAEIDLETRGAYHVVLIVSLVRDARTLGCAGVEYYRVNPVTRRVEPFDGCVEGHRSVPELPGIRQLPD